MQVTRYIERHGFRRWYERQLIESHAYLALGFVALILLLSGMELLSSAEAGMRYAIVLMTAAAGGMLVLVAWRRFGVLLARAEHFGEAATCPQCKAWGKFKVLAQESSNANRSTRSRAPALVKRSMYAVRSDLEIAVADLRAVAAGAPRRLSACALRPTPSPTT